MTNVQLTPGAVTALRTRGGAAQVLKPTLQVLSATALQVSGSERYKLEISDGAYSTSAMLATQHNELIKKNALRANTVIRVKEYITNEVQGKLIVILLDVEVLENPAGRLGNPVEFTEGAAGQQQPTTNSNRVFAPAQQPPMTQQQQQRAPATLQPQQQQAFQAPAQQQIYQAPPQQAYQQQYQAPPQQAYQAPQQQYQQQPQQRYAPVAQVNAVGAGASAGTRAMGRIVPIKHLNPYQNKWTIKARCTSKTDVKTWDKGPNNQGKLFSVDLVDAEGTEIRATFFREAVDTFYPMIEVGNVYTFSEGKIKVANRQFSAIKNEYEISFAREAVIIPVQDSGDITRVQIQPVPIGNLAAVEPKTTVDVMGIVIEAGEVASFTSKQGKDLRKMDLELVDMSNTSVKLTIWNAKADEVAGQLRNAGANPVVAVKACTVGDFGGRSLSTIGSSTVLVNPVDISQSGALRAWYDQGGGRSGVFHLTAGRGGGEGGSGDHRGPAPIEDRVTFDAIKNLGLGRSPTGDYCEVKGHLAFVRKDNLWYPACCTEKCNKKMTKSPTDETWFCEKCNKHFDQPSYRYIASVQVVDPTGSTWCTAFNETGNALFKGHTAQELEALKRENPEQFNLIVEDSQFQEGIFRLKIKEEMYQDQAKIKSTVMSFKPLDYVQECKELLRGITMLQQRQ